MMQAQQLASRDILTACRAGSVPVNRTVSAAIDAHQVAFGRFIAIGDTESHRVAAFALRTVILAMTPESADRQQQLEYLAALPLDAWDVWDGDPAASPPARTRHATLAAISWTIARLADN